jgi:hypothetical protein
MNNIAALNSGTAFHIVSLTKEPFNRYFKKVLYLPTLSFEELKDIDILLITCSSMYDQLQKKKDIFYKFLEEGKTLVVMGRNETKYWLKDIKEVELPFNFWWWLDEKNSIDLEVVKPDYPLFKHIKLKDMSWHYHGGFEIPKNALNVIEQKDSKKSVFFELDNYYGGKLIVTSLDPFYHHGSFFMPNATKFGFGLLNYLKDLKIK